MARGAMDMTVDYLKQRKQFGKLIGEFQALQHRAAHLYSEVEIARAVTIKAQQLLDAGAQNAIKTWIQSFVDTKSEQDALYGSRKMYWNAFKAKVDAGGA